MFIDNPFDLIDEQGALSYQTLPDLGIGGKNAPDTVGTLSAFEPFPVIPKECAKGICIALIGLVHGCVIGWDDNNFFALGLLEFFEQPVVETANFNDDHIASMFACLFDEGDEKLVNIVRTCTDLSFLKDTALLISDVDS